MFMELQQQLYKQEIRLCRGSSNKNDGDRVKRMKSLLRASKSPEEALLMGCSHFDSDNSHLALTSDRQNSYDSIIQKRQEEYQDVRIELEKNLRHAVWLQRQIGQPPSDITQPSFLRTWQRDLKEDSDPEGSIDLTRLLGEAENNYSFDHQDEFYRDDPSKEEKAKEQAEMKRRRAAAKAATKRRKRGRAAPTESSSEGCQVRTKSSAGKGKARGTHDGGEVLEEDPTIDEEEIVVPPEPIDSRPSKIDLEDQERVKNAMKNVMKHIRKLGSEFLSRKRALRFLSVARGFNLWQCEMGPPPTCLGCGEGAIDPANISVLGVCGHVACTECLKKGSASAGCVSEQCSSAAGPQHIHVATDFASTKQADNSHGTKIDSIVQLIHKVTEDDQVLLFVQFESLLDVVYRALEASGITFHAIRDGGTSHAAEMARDFQENVSEGKVKVLILNPSNESAAGL